MPEPAPPIWEVLARLAAELPTEEAAKLPANLAVTIGHEWERIAALETALRALMAVEPVWKTPGTHQHWCLHCLNQEDRTTGCVTHEPDCPWVQARALLDPPKEMQTLSLDFNRVDAQGRVRIGPEAWKRQRLVLLKLYVDDRVLVVDDDGAQCEGILEQTNTVEHVEGGGARFRCVVRLDRTTWQDGSDG